jgi:hypothetical protein
MGIATDAACDAPIVLAMRTLAIAVRRAHTQSTVLVSQEAI